jgi:hypothetical protein
MSLENKKPNQHNVFRKIGVSPPVCCRILYFLVIDNERKNTSTTNCPKKNFTKLQERRRFSSFGHTAEKIRELLSPQRMQVARSQNDNCSLFSPPKNRTHPGCGSRCFTTCVYILFVIGCFPFPTVLLPPVLIGP